MKYQMAIVFLFIFNPLIQGCSEDAYDLGSDIEDFYSGPILIWNLSQFELQELYTHNYAGFDRGTEGDCQC